MFNFSEKGWVPGFRARDPEEEVPGFRLAPDGSIQRSGADFLSSMHGGLEPDPNPWPSGHFLDMNAHLARNPYLRILASRTGQTRPYPNWEFSKRENRPSQMWVGMTATSLGRNVTHVVRIKLWGGDFPILSVHIVDVCERA